MFPNHAVAASLANYNLPSPDTTVVSEEKTLNRLPVNELKKPDEVRYVTMTAYSSTPDQTDDTPFITADGTHVRWGIAAANFLPLNTQIRLPDMFGEQMFSINDRMHPRFSDRIDIWFPTRAEAKEFGRRRLKVEIWY